jgi:hypothetical protein
VPWAHFPLRLDRAYHIDGVVERVVDRLDPHPNGLQRHGSLSSRDLPPSFFDIAAEVAAERVEAGESFPRDHFVPAATAGAKPA